MTTKCKPVDEFAEELSNAYSTDNYRNGWRACIRMLRQRGYNDREIEAIVRSKWTRWAADSSTNRYGQHTAKDLARFLDTVAGNSNYDIGELVRGTFGD